MKAPSWSQAQIRSKQYSWFLIGEVAFVLYLTLFPFDFVVDGFSTWLDVKRGLIWSDLVQNILLFIPLGFGLAGLLQYRERVRRILVGTIAGLVLSVIVETGQLFLLRETSVWDVAANTAGATAGVLLFLLWGGQLEAVAVNVWGHMSRRWQAAGFLLLALLLLSSGWRLQRLARLGNWSASYPLLVANELSGDRPWRGELRLLQLVDRALTQDEINRLLSDSEEIEANYDGLIGDYHFEGTNLTLDRTGQLPELQMRETDGVVWWATASPVSAWTERVRMTSAFTVSMVAAAAETNQTGPARIVSISADPFHRNFTLGQEGSALVVRIRTRYSGENGRKPELVIPGVFADNDFHHVVVRHDKTAVWVYVDDVKDKFSFYWSPASLLIWLLTTREVTQFRPNALSSLLFNLIHYGLLAALLLAFLYYLKTGP